MNIEEGGRSVEYRDEATYFREEFERMLDKVVAVVGDVAAPSWQHYLRGLWTSGLRLGESLDLHWDRPDKLRVDMDGKRPMLHIPAELEKGNKDRLLPMAPEFAEFLAAVPPEERTGPVFKPLTRRGKRPSKWWASRTVCAVGKKTVVKVDQRTKGNKLVVKYASAHDLRRSFGERWGKPRHAPSAHGANAPREHRNDAQVLRGSQR